MAGPVSDPSELKMILAGVSAHAQRAGSNLKTSEQVAKTACDDAEAMYSEFRKRNWVP